MNLKTEKRRRNIWNGWMGEETEVGRRNHKRERREQKKYNGLNSGREA